MSRASRAAALLAAVLGATFLAGLVCRPAGIPNLPEGDVVLAASEKGVTYKVHGGNAYRVDARTGRWHLVQRVYDPDFRAKHYVERDGAIFRKADDGTPVAVRRRFADGFEDAGHSSPGWTIRPPGWSRRRRVVCLRSGLRPFLRHTTRTVPQLSHEHRYRKREGVISTWPGRVVEIVASAVGRPRCD